MSSSSTHMPTLEDRDRAKETPSIRHLSRHEMLGLVGSTAIAVTFAGCGGEQSGSSSSPSSAGRRPTPEGPGSGAPNLPEGFADTFTSQYVNAGGLRQHAVVGGEGPPLLLVHSWPENWYAWHIVMPALAGDFEVIAVDSDPDPLRGSFGLYRALDATLAQNDQRKNRPLTMPVLAIGGAESWGEAAGEGMKPAADDVQTMVIPNTCHSVAEQAPEMVAALTEFLDPYRENGGNLR